MNAPAAPASTSPPDGSTQPAARTWADTFKVYSKPAALRMLFLGFSAGLPLVLVFGTLSFWLREAGIDRKTIGFLAWITLAYGFKWAWAPLVDRLPIPLLTRTLGRRRSWLLLAQAGVMVGIVGMALSDPKLQLSALVVCAVLVAFSSATQDIALDAYRIESASADEQAALSATYQTGYRLAMIWAGAGVLWIAARAEVATPANYDFNAWKVAYLCMAASMLVGVVTVLLSPEPAATKAREIGDAERAHAARLAERGMPMLLARLVAWLNGAVVQPFVDFFLRYRWQALAILGLIAVYRISDVVMGVMANPFYVDMKYTKDEVAAVSKVYGLIMTLVGAFVGGALAMRFGVLRLLLLGAVLSAASNLLFAWLAGHVAANGKDLNALIWVVSADNLSAGIASAAFIAYLSSLTNVAYSATQYALFTSIMLLLPKFLSGFSGVAVESVGYAQFFVGTALIGLPVLLLIALVARLQAKTPPSP
jgi:PAT family beta-lactamase induction signal transducer AmpG